MRAKLGKLRDWKLAVFVLILFSFLAIPLLGCQFSSQNQHTPPGPAFSGAFHSENDTLVVKNYGGGSYSVSEIVIGSTLESGKINITHEKRGDSDGREDTIDPGDKIVIRNITPNSRVRIQWVHDTYSQGLVDVIITNGDVTVRDLYEGNQDQGFCG